MVTVLLHLPLSLDSQRYSAERFAIQRTYDGATTRGAKGQPPAVMERPGCAIGKSSSHVEPSE